MPRTGSYFEEVTSADAAATVADGAPPSGEEESPFERGTTLGRYVVLERLGSGGMGVVLAAYDSTLDRRVALKLLRQHGSQDPKNHARMLREAQSLARLSHPAVVSVYDVGELRGRVFIAMEFIDGPDMRRWLREQERSTAAIIGVYREAALGLQAAHDAGIVHRDFKPDNVLIGSDGHARVTDFGLALDAKTLVPTADPGAAAVADHEGRLTLAGTVMGTPAYMAPEQHRGQPTDHRSDQFAFCVSLFESLYGLRPFSGNTAAEYCAAIERGRLPPPTTPRSVPRRVHRAIVRGLSAAPAKRFGSMRALIRALTPRTRRKRLWILGGVGGLAVGAGAVVLAQPATDACGAFEQRMEATYSEADARRILQRFNETGVPFAASSFDTATDMLDDYAKRWVDGARDACLASERGAQSDRMLDLRMQCLGRAHQRLEATVEALATAETVTVESAPDLVWRLPSLEPCADVAVLEQRGYIPENAEQRRDAEELLPILDRASLLAWQDRTAEAEAVLSPFDERLAASTHPRIRAYYPLVLGQLTFGEESTEYLEQALHRALEHSLDELAAVISIRAAYVAKDLSRFDHADAGFRRAVALGRSAGAKQLEIDGYMGLSKLEEAQLHYDEAIANTRKVLERVEAGRDPGLRASNLILLSSLLMLRDGTDAGLEELAQAQALLARKLDEDHPAQEEYLQEVLKRANARADPQRAIEASETLLALLRRNRGPGSTREAVTLANLSTAYLSVGRHEDALEATDKADEYLRKGYGGDYPDRSGLLNNRGNILLRLGRFDDARTTFERARELFEERLGPDSEGTAVVRLNLADLEHRAGRLDEARAHAEASLDIFETKLGDSHVRVARALVALATVDLASDAPHEAKNHLARAREIGTPKRAESQLWTMLYAEATLRAPGTTQTERTRVLGLVERERDGGLIQGTPYSDRIAQALGRIESLTGRK
ncbi:MAG: protein kinase domain-containing protein [Nannocystaceae bacterium]|nr:serine/threonine-protein kinase [bacterium]